MHTPNKSLDDLIDSYYNPKIDRYQDESTILAVKKVLSYKPQEAIKYLNVDSVLDGMNYRKDFSKNREEYEEYLNFALFDRDLPEDKMGYLNSLKGHSRIIDRLVAAKIIDEDKNLTLDYVSSICEEPEEDSIYDLANLYLQSREYHMKENAIREAIFQTIRYSPQEDSLKILGEDPFLDFISLNKKMGKGRFDLFADEARQVYGISPKSKLEEFEAVQEIVDCNLDNRYTLIAEKLRREYFPSSGLTVSSFEDFWDEDDE